MLGVSWDSGLSAKTGKSWANQDQLVTRGVAGPVVRRQKGERIEGTGQTEVVACAPGLVWREKE